jgi:hypothetical protein
MHRVDVYTHYFFIPNRLVWNEWEDFITGGNDGKQAPVHPSLVVTNSNKLLFSKGSLSDYLGVPTFKNTDNLPGSGVRISALPFRAYQMIYNEYYRDQNLTDEIDFTLSSGNISAQSEVTKLTTLRSRCWEKDYFTSALPFPQRGDAVELPLGQVVPNYKTQTEIVDTTGGHVPTNHLLANSDKLEIGPNNGNPTNVHARIENLDPMPVDSVTINELRKAEKLQRWLEKSARSGYRYIEQILSHFGVKSSDARLQRPEFLGGGKQPVVISEVLNTTGTDDAPQGTMAGHGISVGSQNRFKQSFEEHGFIIGIVSVLPKTAYQQGLNKMFSRFDKFDYYFPEFANLGEQAVLNKEVFLHDFASMEETWGYQERYAEYKYSPSSVHGDFRDNLAFWHLGRIFSNLPPLNENFVEADPSKRIFAVEDPTVDELLLQIYHRVDAIRPMPYHSIPSLT